MNLKTMQKLQLFRGDISVSLPSTPRGPPGKGLLSTCYHACLCLSDPSPIIPIRLSPTQLKSVAEAKQSGSEANAAQSRAKANAEAAPSASSSCLSLSLSLASVASFGSLVGPPLPSRDEIHGALFPASEDEAMEVEHLLLEPQIEKDLSNNIMLMGSEHSKECLAIEDFTFAFVDSMLQGVNEGNLHGQSNFRSICPELFWDNDCAESLQVKCVSQNTSCLRNFRSDLQTKSIEIHSDAGEFSDLSNALNSPYDAATPDRDAFFFDDISTDQLPDVFRSTLGWDTSVEGKQSLEHHILFEFQNLTEINKFSSPSQCSSMPNEIDDEMMWIPKKLFDVVSSPFGSIFDTTKLVVGIGAEKPVHCGRDVRVGNFSEAHKTRLGDEDSAVITNKRLRKPTRRYIEETSDLKSRCCRETRGLVIQKQRGLHASRVQRRKNAAVTGNETIISKDEFLTADESRATYALRFPKSESRNNASEDWTRRVRNEKSGIRRKHHRLWTLPEVMKLIEGVSHYGVGRWTDIKRLLFATSAFRTSVDLKDKWRNLLRASAAQLHDRKQVGPHKKHVTLPIPQYVMRRIRELSAIHPYPRERKPRALLISSNPVFSRSNDNSSSGGDDDELTEET
ncbi:SANT [Musa troglodytarum]|uniref:SANT n=1 Tax=Musa troglodytarum TaxID=320322 RepID=A0A9E7FXS2_9LILI|nr:SANT [Musa troglodytarum]